MLFVMGASIEALAAGVGLLLHQAIQGRRRRLLATLAEEECQGENGFLRERLTELRGSRQAGLLYWGSLRSAHPA
jgi:hypothetical protein